MKAKNRELRLACLGKKENDSGRTAGAVRHIGQLKRERHSHRSNSNPGGSQKCPPRDRRPIAPAGDPNPLERRSEIDHDSASERRNTSTPEGRERRCYRRDRRAYRRLALRDQRTRNPACPGPVKAQAATLRPHHAGRRLPQAAEQHDTTANRPWARSAIADHAWPTGHHSRPVRSCPKHGGPRFQMDSQCVLQTSREGPATANSLFRGPTNSAILLS